jgi:hypothetical protein
MQASGIRMLQQNWAAGPEVPWLARILGKFVLDILPAALASVVGGFLFTQYHFGQMSMPQPAADQGAPASAEMVAMVRDEHALIVNYLKAQMAAEKSRDVADDAAAARAAADAQTAADAKLADALRASQAAAQPSAAPVVKPHAHPKPPVALAAAPHAPLVIAQSDQNPKDALAPDVAPGEAIARDPNSLLAKTLDVKDHFVAATRRVVSVIGDMFASVGDSIGGAVSGSRQFNSAS